MIEFLGVVGLALILVGWTVELAAAIKAKKSQVPLSFAALYAAGSLLLVWHSFEINDAVFLALNAAAAAVAAVNIVFCLGVDRRKNR